MDKISKIWAISRVLCQGVGIPRSSVGPHQGLACPCRGVAKRGLGQASGMLHCGDGVRRGITLFTAWKFLVFFHVLLSSYSEDLSIGLMRTQEVYERVHSCL